MPTLDARNQPISTQASPEGAHNKKTPNAETIAAMENALNGGAKSLISLKN